MIGYEPHSALPVGIPSVFSTPSPRLPKFLTRSNFHSLASGVCFLVPFVRQLWWWLVSQWDEHTNPLPPFMPCMSASAPSAVPQLFLCEYRCPASQTMEDSIPSLRFPSVSVESIWPRCCTLLAGQVRGMARWLGNISPLLGPECQSNPFPDAGPPPSHQRGHGGHSWFRRLGAALSRRSTGKVRRGECHSWARAFICAPFLSHYIHLCSQFLH